MYKCIRSPRARRPPRAAVTAAIRDRSAAGSGGLGLARFRRILQQIALSIILLKGSDCGVSVAARGVVGRAGWAVNLSRKVSAATSALRPGPLDSPVRPG